MAVTKIKPIKSTLSKALEYIQNPKKTDDKILVSSFACSYETADIEFGFTLSKAADKGNNLAHHLIQSFDPGEVTPEQAHAIGQRMADEILKGRHEYVLTTHVDKGHVHNHIIFCAVNFMDYHKYNSNKKSYFNIRNASDRICRESGLSIVKPGKEKGKGSIEYTDTVSGQRVTRPAKEQGRSYAEYAADKTGGGSWKSKLKIAIDLTIPQSKDFEDFLKRLQEQGYEIKRGKYISVRAPGQERFTRTKTLGEDYAEDAITARIKGEYVRAPLTTRDGKLQAALDGKAAPDTAVNLIKDIESTVQAQQAVGVPRWAKMQNLREVVNTINFLTENKLLRYADLEAKAGDVAAAFDKTNHTLKTVEKRLSDMAVLMKHITTYQQTKPVYDGLKTAKNKDTYRREHESALIVHEAAIRALKPFAGDGGKLPNPAALQTEHEQLTERKTALTAEYKKLEQSAREYGIVKRNVDSILTPGDSRGKTKQRDAEL